MNRRVLLLGFATLIIGAITACERKGYLDTIPIKGGLQTPEGLVEFHQVTSRAEAKKLGLEYYGGTHEYIFAEGRSSQIIFIPFVSTSTLSILTPQSDYLKKIYFELDIGNAFYQIDEGEKEKWVISERYRLTETSRRIYTKKDGINYWSTDLRIETIPFGEDITAHTYRYYLPYKIDGVSYTMDVTVKFRKNYDYSILFGAPGSP